MKKNKKNSHLDSVNIKYFVRQFLFSCFLIYFIAFLFDNENFFTYFQNEKSTKFKDIECNIIKYANIAVNKTHAQVYVKINQKNSNLLHFATNYIRLMIKGEHVNQEMRIQNTTTVDFSGNRFLASFYLEQNGINTINGLCLSSKLFHQNVTVNEENSIEKYTFFVNDSYVRNVCVTKDTVFYNTQSFKYRKLPSISSHFAYSKIRLIPRASFDDNNNHLLIISSTLLNRRTTNETQQKIIEKIESYFKTDDTSQILFFQNQEQSDVYDKINYSYHDKIVEIVNNEPKCFSSIQEIHL